MDPSTSEQTLECGNEFDVSKFRNKHESETEWKLKKAFIETHHDKFDRQRLLCLASCYVNVETMGCAYPGPVMEQLNLLKEEISIEH